MRGSDASGGKLFSYVELEKRVPADHPLRVIREIVNATPAAMSAEFGALYSPFGRDAIPPERLPRALLLQTFYWSSASTLTCCSAGLPGWAWMISFGTPALSPRTATVCWRTRSRRSCRAPCWPNRKRGNETHACTTDPDARLFRKGRGKEAKLCFMRHALMEIWWAPTTFCPGWRPTC